MSYRTMKSNGQVRRQVDKEGNSLGKSLDEKAKAKKR